MLKKNLLFFIFLINFIQNAVAQCSPTGTGLSATVNAVTASCPLNGSIAVAVTASAAGAPYTFTLTSSCLTVPVIQSQSSPNYTFTSLQGACIYTVCISDAGGNIISRTATVTNTYPLLTGLILGDSIYTSAPCSKIIASVAGGRAPYNYELFNGNVATGTPNQGPQASNQFSNINASAFYTIRATDACGQSIVSTINTSPYAPQLISLSEAALESCNSIRESIFLNNFYGGQFFQDNNLNAAAGAGLKFPIVVTAKNSTGAVIAGYPYTMQPFTAAGWGQSANTNLNSNLRWAPRIPNTPSLFPVTFSYTDACGAAANLVIPYNAEFAKAAYVTSPVLSLDTNVCPVKNCIKIVVGGNYVAGTNYTIGLYTNPAATGAALQTIIYPAQNTFCGLNFSTTYYFKTYDPCLNKDTIVSAITGAPLAPFSVTLNNCNTFCDGLVTTGFSFTGLYPNSVIATSGPSTYGPYPKGVAFSVTTTGVGGVGSITGLLAGTYNLVFATKCGETANASIVVTQGSLTAQPVTTITPTGCASSSVKITPHLSAMGQMLVYHTAPGCHTAAGAAYYANIIIGQVSGGAPLPGSNNIVVDNPNDGYTVNVTTPGTYVAIIAYSQGLPGINNAVSSCYQTVRDTFTVAFNTIPTIVRIYTLPCTSGAYSIVPIAPNAVTGITYTLFAANGTTVLAGPQVSNTFSNINVSAGTNLIIKSLDPCGQSSSVPFTITTATSITGGIDCLSIGTNSSADSLHADFINGATYTWSAPNGTTYTGNNPPLVIPSQTGVWNLTTTIQSGPCTATLTNTFTTIACGTTQPTINDTITLAANANACKVTLNWTTATEQNSVRFDVECSIDNVNWNIVGTIAAAGNSNTLKQYSITLTPTASQVFYRIKLVKTTAQVKYSNIVPVTTSCPVITSDNDILTVDNNPGNSSLRYLSSIGRGNAVIVFVDAIGRQYLKKPIVVNRGANYFQFKPSQYLAKGAYFVRLVGLDQKWYSNTVKIIVLK